MKWKGRRQSSNVEDRRGGGGSGGRGFGGGGFGGKKLGIGGIIIVLIISFLFGENPLNLINGGGGESMNVQQQNPTDSKTR